MYLKRKKSYTVFVPFDSFFLSFFNAIQHKNIGIIEKPPFEVTETGWGEFNVGMRIIFTDPTLPHMDIIHPLKLYPPSKL
jgi:hypothetical protein